MSHATHDVHQNSRISFAALDLGARESLIMSVYFLAGVALSDRQVAEHLGFTDLNCVRPRCSSLVDRGLLTETGAVKCPETGRRVRVLAPTALARKGA